MPQFASPDVLLDGLWLQPTPVDPPRPEYPFLGNGDRISAVFEQDYWQRVSTYQAPDLKKPWPQDPTYFLIDESNPIPIPGGLFKFTRTYARIPTQQVVPDSQFITKPDLPGEFPQDNGTALIVQPEENVPRWYFFTRQAVTGDSGPPTGTFVGGSFTLTYGAATTAAIAHNASAVAVQAAINALSTLPDDVTVAGSAGGPYIVTQNAKATPTVDASLITVSGGTKSATVNNNGITGFHFLLNISTDLGQTVTGGTFTLTLFGQTTAPIAYNATAATAQAAINALSNVTARGGVTCYASSGSPTILAYSTYVFLRIEFNAFSLFTATNSLLPGGGSIDIAATGITYFKNTQQVTLTAPGASTTRTLTVTAHGFSLTDSLVVRIGTSFYTLAAGSFTLPDANTVAFTEAAGEAFTAEGEATYIGTSTGSAYTGGEKHTRIKRVTDFYLPGVTPDIDTIDDIPLPTYQGDDASLLAAIFAGSTEINYDVGGLSYWRGGPIVQRTRVTLDASQL